jgi:predicted secreted protein with PEFG-CTERM motif
MEGSIELTAEQASMLLDGELYINIHTGANPNGEIRGQVICESAPDGGSTETATVVIGDEEFEIQYTISGGTLEELTADSSTQTLMASISSTSDGNLTIWLPTEVIDADNDFSVFIDGASANFTEMAPSANARILEIEFDEGAEEIEIMGTTIVPEFGSLALIVASISIVGVIIASKRFHRFGGLRT